jgi:uncharacterized protein
MSLAFPDVNVWLALAIEHIHQEPALRWWREEAGSIGFCRFTQLGFLRLLTTDAVMAGKPLTMHRAWSAYDRLLNDERVEFVAEPSDIEPRLRRLSSGSTGSPKLWADAYLLAFAEQLGGALITFDRALARRGRHNVLLR